MAGFRNTGKTFDNRAASRKLIMGRRRSLRVLVDHKTACGELTLDGEKR